MGWLVNNQHGIAEGTEHVVALERFLVGIHHHIIATKCGDEHEHGGERHLEVHHKRIGYGEVVYFALPNSKIFMSVSTKHFIRVDKDAGTYLVEPDIECSSNEAMDKLYEVI